MVGYDENVGKAGGMCKGDVKGRDKLRSRTRLVNHKYLGGRQRRKRHYQNQAL